MKFTISALFLLASFSGLASADVDSGGTLPFSEADHLDSSGGLRALLRGEGKGESSNDFGDTKKAAVVAKGGELLLTGGEYQRRLKCEDYPDTVAYEKRTAGNVVRIKCDKLTKQATNGRNINGKCAKSLFGMEEFFGADGKVSDACPVACGTPCEPGEQGRGMAEWGSVFQMQLIPIHTIVFPGGDVLSYGSDIKGKQGGGLFYEVWDLSMGTQEEAHAILEHTTNTDTFCTSLNVDPSSGNIIIMGGDTREPGNTGGGIKDVLEFDYRTHEIRKHPKGDMNYARWYGTSVTLPNGNIFVVGGRDENKRGTPVPELWTPENGFQPLKGAEVPALALDSTRSHYYYPHTYVNSKGEIIVIMPRKAVKGNCDVYRVGANGDGNIDRIGIKPFEAHVRSPSIMFRTDKVLFLDDGGDLWIADISGNTPNWAKKTSIGDARTNGSFSLLPDGRVAIMGGASSTDDAGMDLSKAVFTVQIWDPETNLVEEGPKQQLARLYHSSQLTLPDGTVLSAGGGAPGPLSNLNGQLYFPGYLFDGNQDMAARPIIEECPSNAVTDDDFLIVVDETSKVEKVTATKSGSSSHTRNCDTRWLDLDFEVVNDKELRVFTETKSVMIAGLWMVNTIDKDGVPSEASLVGVNMAQLTY